MKRMFEGDGSLNKHPGLINFYTIFINRNRPAFSTSCTI
jgi:hypothetical protein